MRCGDEVWRVRCGGEVWRVRCGGEVCRNDVLSHMCVLASNCLCHYDTILQQIEMRNNSYRTFSYNVSRLYLNTYDPVCPIGIKTCYVCQLEAQHL